MQTYYHIYEMADILLKAISEQPDKQMQLKRISKLYVREHVVQLLQAKEFAVVHRNGKSTAITITRAGENHLSEGGFIKMFAFEPLPEKNICFKEHLNDNINLLTIFGILNAIILFAQQKNDRPVSKTLDLFRDGMEFISISMYLLSILVLVEIIQSTLASGVKSWKFHVFYLCLCTTTVGIGLLFIDRYGQIIILAVFWLMFLAILFLFFRLILWLSSKFLVAIFLRFKKRKDLFSFVSFILALALTYTLFRVAIHF